MSVKFITSIYSDLNGTEFGGRVARGGHYRFSLLSLLKMTDADFLCYTSDRELEGLKTFFYEEKYNISICIGGKYCICTTKNTGKQREKSYIE